MVAEAIFAGKKVEKFSNQEILPLFAYSNTVFAAFAEYLLVRYGPRHGSNGYCKDKEPDDLRT
jgi:hypothetical protein